MKKKMFEPVFTRNDVPGTNKKCPGGKTGASFKIGFLTMSNQLFIPCMRGDEITTAAIQAAYIKRKRFVLEPFVFFK
jgi:hypothetical protein